MKRRTFLKLSGGVAVAAALPPVLGTTAPPLQLDQLTWHAVGDIKAFFDYSRATPAMVPIVYRVWTGEIWLDLNSYVNDLPKERS
jgi:hypothetical protein